MKGMMVLLLTFWMTGMVMGQQFQNTDQFGNPINPNQAQARSVMSQNGTSAGNSDPNQVNQVNQLGPLELVLDSQLIEKFRVNGQLAASVEPRGYVNEIIIKFAGNEANRDLLANLEPVSKQGDVLYFELDDRDLQTIKTQGLRYRYSSLERARYSKIVVDYVRPGYQKSNANAIAGGNGSDQFGGQSNSFPAPSPEYPADFVGPIPPWADTTNSRQTTGLQNPGSWGTSSNPGNVNRNSSDYNGFAGNSGSQFNSNPAVNNNFGGTSRNTPASTSGYDRFNAAPSGGFAATGNNDQYGANQFGNGSIRNNGFGSSNQLAPITDNSALARAQRDKEELEARQAAALQRDLDLKKRELAIAENENRIKEEQLKEQEYRQQLEYENYKNSQMASAGERYAAKPGSNYSDQLINGFQSNAQRNPTDLNPRLAQNTPNGVRSLAAAIPGLNGPVDSNEVRANPQSQLPGALSKATETNDKTWGLMYFMLLFSLGLNVYLGWISRGFYVRYNELADELRETFTSTM